MNKKLKKSKKYPMTAIMALTLSSIILLSGCGKKEPLIIDDNEVVMSVKDYEIDYATACTYARISQAETYNYIMDMSKVSTPNIEGSETVTPVIKKVWDEPLEGEEFDTYGEEFQNVTLDALKNMLLSEAHMDDYQVSFTEEDEKKCREVASEFLTRTNPDAIKAMNTDERSLINMLKLMTVEQRVRRAIQEEVDTDVSEKEAAQSTFSYVTIDKASKDDKKYSVDKFKKDFEKAADDAGMEVKHISYTIENPEYEEYGKEMLEKAITLKEGECDSYNDEAGNIIVIYMKDVEDETATEEKKFEIINDRKKALYDETINKWKEKDKIKLNDEAFDNIAPNDDIIFTSTKDDSKAEFNNDDSSTEINITASDGEDVVAEIK